MAVDVQGHGTDGAPSIFFAVVVEQGVFFIGGAGSQPLLFPFVPLRATQVGGEPSRVHLLEPFPVGVGVSCVSR